MLYQYSSIRVIAQTSTSDGLLQSMDHLVASHTRLVVWAEGPNALIAGDQDGLAAGHHPLAHVRYAQIVCWVAGQRPLKIKKAAQATVHVQHEASTRSLISRTER